MKVKIAGKKGRAITKSTKRTTYEDAYAYAVEEYTRLTNAHRLGKALHDITFEQHLNEWFRWQVLNAGGPKAGKTGTKNTLTDTLMLILRTRILGAVCC